MKIKATSLLLPSFALAGALLLVAPPDSPGYSTIGGSLSLDQRDVRTFNNFTDASANDNQVPHAQFPGHQGAVMAIWKSAVEWGSELHGTGDGDTSQAGDLGSGGANFDASFQGEAEGVGSSNHNIHSEISGGDGGVLAYTETPISDGWRIRYYSTWTWSDGPGLSLFGQKDLQGVATHEYGHALGLGHSAFPAAVMYPSTFSGNDQRDLYIDDQNGVRFIYGVKSGSKPHVSSASLAGDQVTVTGTGFDATNNEVWFTNQLVTKTTDEPLVKALGIASTGGGTSITLTIPDLAGPGDVLVRVPGSGGDALSNAHPFDGLGAGPSGPQISSITPGTISAVNPGSAQFVTIDGTDFTPTTTVAVDGQPLVSIPSPFTVVSDTQITFAPQLASQLGTVDVTVTTEYGVDTAQITIVANDPPALEANLGDEPVFVTSFAGVDFTLGAGPGDAFILGVSTLLSPTDIPGVVHLDIGGQFASLFDLGTYTIGPAGHSQVHIGLGGLGSGFTFYAQGVNLSVGPPFTESNVQECFLIF